jgi:uncharacterized protein YfaS (alpha-2-macroglobulin family)
MPNTKSSWKFVCIAYGKNLQSGIITQEVTSTEKELLIQSIIPKNLRAGNKIPLTIKVTNLTDEEQKVSLTLDLLDERSYKSRNTEFKNDETPKIISLPAKQSQNISWFIEIPSKKTGIVKYRITGETKTQIDIEEDSFYILTL